MLLGEGPNRGTHSLSGLRYLMERYPEPIGLIWDQKRQPPQPADGNTSTDCAALPTKTF